MIAELAGVSRGTVDRVLNDRGHISKDAQEKVISAISQTGYISPHDAHYHTLTSKAKPLHLGVLLPNWDNQFQREIMLGIDFAQEILAPMSVRISVCRCKTDLPQESLAYLRDLRDNGIAGIAGIAVCVLNDKTIAQYLSDMADNGIPCITFNSDLPDNGRVFFVGQDIHKAGRLAGELMSKCVNKESRILATGRRDDHR